MKEFFDSSALVAAMLEDEGHHEFCAQALANTRNGYAAVHSIVETYATLTGGRLGIQLSPAEASELIHHNLSERLSFVTLTPREYLRLVKDAGPAGSRGGSIYDLLILSCAVKVGADRIYTLNQRHFKALAPKLGDRLVSI